MDRDQAALLRHFSANISAQKNEVGNYFSELNLKLPTWLKHLTIKELREAGAEVNPNIHLSRKTEELVQSHADTSRKKTNILEKIQEVRKNEVNQIVSYFNNTKRQLPEDLLRKKLNDIDSEDLKRFGFDMIRFREIHENEGKRRNRASKR